MLPVSREQVQRPEFVDTESDTAGWRAVVQPPDSPVFRPEFGIVRFLPGFRAPPPEAMAPQDLAEPLQRDRRDDFLLDEIVAQLCQRPDAHADELPRRRERDLADPFDDVRRELPWSTATAEVGIPGDAVDPGIVEAMDDLSDPLGAQPDSLRDLPVAKSATREQNHSRSTAVDRIRQLPFQPLQLPAFVRSQPPCHNLVHLGAPFSFDLRRSLFYSTS